MMVRTQISLDSELHTRARLRAARLGVSFAEYIGRLVDQDLADVPKPVDRSIVFDLGASAGTDISSDKDRMIGQAFGDGKWRRSGAS